MSELEAAVHLRRESTAEQVARALRDLIISGRVSAGAQLREGSLAAQLGVSRNTVREAVGILVSQGLVRREIHRGAYVASPTIDDIRDLFRVRRLVELTAVRELAASDRRSSLSEAVQGLEAAAASGDRAAFTEADIEFHRRLVDLMGSDRLGDLYSTVEAEVRLCIALAAPASLDPSSVIEEHRRMLTALMAGDADLAAKCLVRHLERSEHLLLDHVEAGDHG